MTDPKSPINTDTTDERPSVDYSAITDEALREKLTDPKTLALAAELAPYGVDLLAALASQGDESPPNLIFGPPPVLPPLTHIRTVSARSLFGWKPGETLDEAIARTKAEEAERAGAFMEDALSEQAAVESGDDQAQAFIT